MTQLAEHPTPERVQAAPESSRARAERSPQFGWREVALVLAAACVLSVVMTWPLVTHLDRNIAQDLGDPIRTAWQIAWEGHALLHQQLAFFQANAFWPLRDSLAFSDALLGYTPAGLIGAGPEAALVRYNLLFLFTHALAFVGAYLLARELGAGRAGGAVAGAAFAYAPFRLAMNGHLHVISSGAIPLSIFLMLRGYRRGSPGLVVAGWLVGAWQLSVGFTMGLQLGYLLAVLAAIAVVTWLLKGRPAPPPALTAATLVGFVAFLAVAFVQSRPYLRVADEYPKAERSLRTLAIYSPPPRGYLSAPAESIVWGELTEPVRRTLDSTREQSLFPGGAILALAVVGALAGGVYRRGLRIGLAAGIAVVALLALGVGIGDGRLGYLLLYELAPGWDAIRTPGRLTTLTSLGLALLAGAGAQAIVLKLRRRLGPPAGAAGADTSGKALAPFDGEAGDGAASRGGVAVASADRSSARGRSWRSVPAAATLAAAVLVGLVLLDGVGRIDQPRVPPLRPERLAAPAPQLHAPSDSMHDRLYMYWSTARFPRIVNGVSTFPLRLTIQTRRALRRFPGPESVDYLRRLGVRSVVVHLDLTGEPFPTGGQEALRSRPPTQIINRPTAGLPLRVQVLNGAVVYHLEPLSGRPPPQLSRGRPR